MKGKMKPNRMVRMAEIKLGVLKAITSALGKRNAAESTSSSGSVLEKRCAHVHSLESSWDLHDWTTGQRVYPDSELFISHTLPLLRCHKHCYVVGSFSHLSRAVYTQGMQAPAHVRDTCSLNSKLGPFG